MARIKNKSRKKRAQRAGKITFVFAVILLVVAFAFVLAQSFGFDLSWLIEPKREAKPVSAGTLEIHMIDVGQGDCILIRAPEGNMLIDAGENKKEVESAIGTYLDDLGITEFKYVIFTHSDSDHIGSADFIMNNYAVDEVILSDDERTTNVYKDMMSAIDKNGADIVLAVPNNKYSIGEMEFTVLAPLGDGYKDVNDYSVVVRIDFGESSFLMTGDAEARSEEEIVAIYGAYDLDCDVIKVGHHGSRGSSTNELLALVTPEAALISCGEGNKYGHPHKEAIDRIDNYTGDNIYRTDLLEDIIVITDGERIRINGALVVDESSSKG